MAIKIEMLRCFAAVARHGNLSDAAATLARTPSAVSMMLKQLETHLGDALFETDRKNRLTALGAFVLEHAERELQQFDNTVKTIQGFAQATYGRVRIAAVPSVAGTIIPQVISERISDLHHVEIEIRDMDSASVLHELTRGRVDIGLATRSTKAVGLHSQLLLEDAFGVVCAPDHPLAASDAPLPWEALRGTRLISNSLSAGIASPPCQALHAEALLTAQNLTSILAMVETGIGITLLPEMALLSSRSPGLCFVPLQDAPAKRQIHLLRNTGSQLSPAAKLMEQQIIETAGRFQPGPAVSA